MKIHDVLMAMSKVQEGVDAGDVAIKRVYPYRPPGQDDIDTPCVINQWRLVSQTLRPNGFRELRYVIRSQLLIAESGANFDLYSQQAAMLHDALIVAQAANLQLDGTVSLTSIRGDEAEYMPVILEREPNRYIGLQYLTDITINDVVTAGP